MKLKRPNLPIWLLIIFAVIFGLWAALVWVYAAIPAPELLKRAGVCPSGLDDGCFTALTALGALGDSFAIITSLFSGLALFAVACTLWSDANARREARQPLVTSQLADDPLILRSPVLQQESSIQLDITSVIMNVISEAAVNVRFEGEMVVGSSAVCKFHHNFDRPITSSQSEDVKETCKIEGAQLQSLLSCLTGDHGKALLKLRVQYSNLENVYWETEVEYLVSCSREDDRRRLNSVRSATDDFTGLWANGERVLLEACVKPRSFFHKRKE
jgi:hypothetical protein